MSSSLLRAGTLGFLVAASFVAGWWLERRAPAGASARAPAHADPVVAGAPITPATAATSSPRPGEPPGKWQLARDLPPPASVGNAVSRPELLAVPYLAGYQRATGLAPGVSDHDPVRAAPGFNLYTSGHAAAAFLIDMEGRRLHRWRRPLRAVWPELAADPIGRELDYWRRVHLLPNGDLLAIFDGLGLIKLDQRSRLLWAYRGGIHHDLEVLADGRIVALDRDARLLPHIDPLRPVLEDHVTVLDAAGRVESRFSLLRAFESSPWAPLLARMPRTGDVFHTNTVEVLDGRLADALPAFRAGNLLISVLELDAIAVVDPRQQRVVWAATGGWKKQHQPTVTGRHLLLFDNLGAGNASRVLELDPRDGRVVWQYGGRPADDFLSRSLGSCQRLSNGNTLITESTAGRAREVTPAGEAVWRFSSPHRAGERGELVAALFEMERLERPTAFLAGASTAPETGTAPARRGGGR